jgi:hypothetical protein
MTIGSIALSFPRQEEGKSSQPWELRFLAAFSVASVAFSDCADS